MKIRMDIPSLGPDVIIKVVKAAEKADVQFGNGRSRAKKVWLREQVMPAMADLELPKVPSWLVEPIKEAAMSVIIDTVWALRERDREGQG